MFNPKFIFILLFCIYSINAYPENEAGFDEICKIYTEALNSSMTKEQLSEYIFDNVKTRVNSIDALEAHAVVFNLDPAKRYSIFKQSAELSLKHNWGCEPIKILMK
jgi:hypothetical protein